MFCGTRVNSRPGAVSAKAHMVDAAEMNVVAAIPVFHLKQNASVSKTNHPTELQYNSVNFARVGFETIRSSDVTCNRCNKETS